MKSLNMSVFTPPFVDFPCDIAVDRIGWKDAVMLSFLEGLCRDCSFSHSCPAIFPIGGAEVEGTFVDED